MIFVFSLLIWCLMVVAAIINGAIREKLLVTLVGEKVALPLSGITLSALMFLIAYLFVPLLGKLDSQAHFAIGGLWLGLTLAFEYLFGHFIQGESWSEINKVFHVHRGNLFALVLITCTFSPYLVGKAHGII